MCFRGGKTNHEPEPSEAAKLTIIHTPPPPEVEKFPDPEDRVHSRAGTRHASFLSATPPPSRPWTPTHNKRSSRGTALIERNRLSDIEPHEVQRASHGDLESPKFNKVERRDSDAVSVGGDSRGEAVTLGQTT